MNDTIKKVWHVAWDGTDVTERQVLCVNGKARALYHGADDILVAKADDCFEDRMAAYHEASLRASKRGSEFFNTSARMIAEVGKAGGA